MYSNAICIGIELKTHNFVVVEGKKTREKKREKIQKGKSKLHKSIPLSDIIHHLKKNALFFFLIAYKSLEN